MSNEQEAKNVENEPKLTDELDNEALDQVVGGAGPSGTLTLTPPTLPPTNSLSLTYQKVEFEYKAQ